LTGEGTRVLGLDLGTVRVGLAISDPLGLSAQPAGVLRRRGARLDLAAVADLVASRHVTRVVVGHPLRLSGEAGPAAAAAERFAAALRTALPDVDVVLWDERLTTAEARRILIAADVRRRRRREVIDSMAAVLLLQSWLDSHRAAP
jgi:putative Holliday junction resolvase